MTFHCLDPAVPCKPSVAVHYEGDMTWDWTLPQRADEQFPDLIESPFRGWRGYKPFPKPRSHHRVSEVLESKRPKGKKTLKQRARQKDSPYYQSADANLEMCLVVLSTCSTECAMDLEERQNW
jgi:hypothetical protein